jgi:hypothetical protein
MTITSGTGLSINVTMPSIPPTDIVKIRTAVKSGAEIFGADIETDTSGLPFMYPNGTDSLHPAGLDPRVSKVITAAIAGSKGTSIVLDSMTEEAMLLDAIGAVFTRLDRQYFSRAVVVGWNSTFFDIPFMCVRSHMTQTTLRPAVRRNSSKDYTPKYGFPEWANEVGKPEWNEAFIGDVEVIDIAPYFKQYAINNGIRHSLKPVAEHLGFAPVSVDASQVHELSPQERSKYCLSDSLVTVGLALWLAENAD